MKEVEQCCRTCLYYFQGMSCAPCTYCINFDQWVEDEELATYNEEEENE